MTIKSNDLLYLTLAIILSVMGVLVVLNPNAQFGLYAVAGILALILAITIILKPTLGANILILAIFTNISDLLTKQGYTGIIKPLVLLVALAIAAHYAYTGHRAVGRSKTSWVEFFLFFYFLVYAASYMVAPNKDQAALAIVDFAKDIVIIYSIQFALRHREQWKQSAWVIMTVAAILAAMGTYQVLTSNYQQTFFQMASVLTDKLVGDTGTPRLGGPVNAPNAWGQILVAVVPFVVYRLIYARRPQIKALSVLYLGMMIFTIFNTYSRAAYLALAIIFFLVILDLRLSPLLAFGSAVVVIIATLSIPSAYADRFMTLSFLNPTSPYGIYEDSSFRGRSSEMLTGLEMFRQHPLLGIGADNYKVNYQEYAQLIGIETRGENRDAHSLFVQVLAETGVIGFIAFMGFVIALLTALTRTRNLIKDNPAYENWLPWLSASRLSIVAYLTTSIFLHNVYFRYFWILAAMAITAVQLTHQRLMSDQPQQVRSERALHER